MTVDQARIEILRAHPTMEADDLDSYTCGPDDPEDYFSKIADTEELLRDFEEFMTL